MMIFKRIESKGLAHYSYMIGDGTSAIVIDPRRDFEVYMKIASRYDKKIDYILETHRHEDFVVGSKGLSEISGGDVLHADHQLDYKYGNAVKDGDSIRLGTLRIEAIATPGHTMGGMSYVLYDANDKEWMVFTGDTIFAGDVGRVDLIGTDVIAKMGELIYDSIFERILPLGDGVMICPAHGAGSVCGVSIANRMWTTIGLEKKLNPKIKVKDKDKFIELVGKEYNRPPYFKRMEILNLTGTSSTRPIVNPLGPKEFEALSQDAFILDTRMDLAFNSAHVPNSLSIWADGIPDFAGWFLPYDRKILLVLDTCEKNKVIDYLFRMGYDELSGYLFNGMLSWHTSGLKSDSIGSTTVQGLCHKIDGGREALVLDVRDEKEIVNEGKIPNSINIPLTSLKDRMKEIPKDKKVHIFCGSGLRSTIAASILKKNGWGNLQVMLGGIKGWNSLTCPLEM